MTSVGVPESEPRMQAVPLSYGQRQLWFLEHLHGPSAAYNVPLAVRLTGALDRDALRAALADVAARHEILRTSFREAAGIVTQHIGPAAEMRLPLTVESIAREDTMRRLEEAARRPFTLDRELPWRAQVFAVAADEHVLLLVVHHIAADGWSLRKILFRDLARAYSARVNGTTDTRDPPKVQHADYARWQEQQLRGSGSERPFETQLAYWTDTLRNLPEHVELPVDHRPLHPTDAAGSVPFRLDAERCRRLKQLARQERVTLFMTLHTAFAALLSRIGAGTDIPIGTVSAGRSLPAFDEVVGLLANTLVLRTDASGNPTFRELLEQGRRVVIDAFRHQDVPFGRVVEALNPSRRIGVNPLFQVMFAFMNIPRDAPTMSALDVRFEPVRTTAAKFDLALNASEMLDADGTLRGIEGELQYRSDLFERDTVQALSDRLVRLLDAVMADPTRRLAQLDVLLPSERRQTVVEWNATTTDYPSDACVHELVEAQVAKTPAAVAVVFGERSLTYAELNGRANRLAHHLREAGVAPDTRVALCMERSLEMCVGVLAVLKAGGAYVPLDPAYPVERVRFMLDDSAPLVLLTQEALAARFVALDVPTIAVDADVNAWANQPATNPTRGALTPDHLAYVIYTSGSTGRPKGVMNQHRCVVNRIVWGQEAWGLEPNEAVLQGASLSFDVSVRELFWPTMVGGRVVLLHSDEYKDPGHLVNTIRREGITTASFVPSMLQPFLEHPDVGSCSSLVRVVCSGEALQPALLRRFAQRLPQAALHNVYGPTEAATAVASLRCAPTDAPRVPIGRPIANTRIYVLDVEGALVPPGVAGELHIGGVQLARGYLDRPSLTAERFVPDPFSGEPGARLYRTGDLGRWRSDGSLEHLGRTDFQVKVRGQRIELGEIEARLAEHPAVRDAVVVVREHTPGDQRLVAYYVPVDTNDPAGAEALRHHAALSLPAYMVPAAYVCVEALPLTPSGKVDRRALPNPDEAACVSRAFEPPVSEEEATLADIWSSVLGAERVGRWDDFFERGGHSLLAAQVISRVRQMLGADVTVADLFRRPVLADFARGVAAASRAALPPIVPVARAERGDFPVGPLEVSCAQQRIWFLEQLGTVGATYHVPWRVQLTGALNLVALRLALDRIVMRHEALRTTFGTHEGEPVQWIAPAAKAACVLIEHDLRGHQDPQTELRRLARAETDAPFDLGAGPLIRGTLICLAGDEHVLLLTLHHLVADGWSKGIFLDELRVLYGAYVVGRNDPLPPIAVQYADYAAWQRQWVAGDVSRAQAEYWRTTLAGAPERLDVPSDHARPAQQDYAGALVPFVLDAASTTALKALSHRHGTTLFMTLLAGWAAVLGRLAGQDDVVIGTPSASRGRTELEGLIGLFVNTLALRVDLSGAPTVAELLARVKAQALGAQQHQDLPFEQIVELVQPARSLAHTPLFQILFVWQHAPASQLASPALTLSPLAVQGVAAVTAKFDLTLTLQEEDGQIVGGVEYATALFERGTVERYLTYLRTLLTAMAAADTGAVVARLPLLPPAERRQVIEEWNATGADYANDACLHQLIESQVERAPAAVAIVAEDRSLTFEALNARANQLAHYLRARGVGPDTRVALCMERGSDLVVSLLAVLKAGGAYVPLDPEYPADRVAFMIADAAVPVLLTQQHLIAQLPPHDALTIAIDADWQAIAAEPDRNPTSGVGLDDLAYVIYTSGSTGRPKAAMNSHRAVVNRLLWMQEALELTAADRVLQKTPFSFDVSVWEFFWPLFTGARLVVARPGGHQDPAYLADVIEREQITTLHFVPSMLRAFLEQPDLEGCRAVTRTVCSGEAMPIELQERFFARLPGALYNFYGPTEAAIDVTWWRCDRAAARHTVPIGRPIANTQIYLLDRALEPVPVGVAGELHIGGAGLARGYLNRPGATAERFIPDPFGIAGGRLYKSGDLARYLPDGAIEFLGRIDHQVKVRGFRIELEEIEWHLREHPAVSDAVVIARADASGDARLVAYVVAAHDRAGAAAGSLAPALAAHLERALPQFMIPSAIVPLDSMPLSANGKIDRRALPDPPAPTATAAFVAPRTELEAQIADIWRQVLGVERIGVDEDFFELGGHSLTALRLTNRLRTALGLDLSVRTIFEASTIAALAKHVAAVPSHG